MIFNTLSLVMLTPISWLASFGKATTLLRYWTATSVLATAGSTVEATFSVYALE